MRRHRPPGGIPAAAPPAPRRALAALLVCVLAAACAPPAAPPPPWAAPAPALPAVAFRDGPLALALVYPPEGATVAVRDTTFVLGGAGTGRAHVEINGAPVAVHPNGAFLAVLPVPADGIYRVQAAAGDERAGLLRRVVVPAPPPVPADGQALVVERSVVPRGGWAALPGEPIEVGFWGTRGGQAALLLPDGTRVPLAERGPVVEEAWGPRVFGAGPLPAATPLPGLAQYRGVFAARPLASAAPDVPRPALAAPPEAGAPAVLELALGAATARVPLPLNLALLDPARPPLGEAFEPEPYPRSAGGVDGAAGPGHTFHYFWANGTELTLTGERAGAYRVRLAPGLHAWVAADRVRLAPPGAPPAAGAVGTVRLTPRPEAVEVRLALDRRFPYRVDVRRRAVDLTVYGAAGDTRWLMGGGLDRHVTGAGWSQPADGVYVLSLALASPHWGHTAGWDANGDLVLAIRRPPAVDRRDPLRGLTIALDPGHPSGGATGPTGLTEAEVNLAIARALAAQLQDAGARVVLTRDGERPMGLYERAAAAAGAHLFVSLHQNAVPDGVDPRAASGTSTFHYHPHAEGLARALQAELLAEFRLRDAGVGRASFAVLRRLTWMPAILTETMFLIVPEQEAALRDPAVQARVARAHRRGLERFLRESAPPR